MTDVDQLFHDVLAASTSIAAICGKRIYPLVIPQDSPLPAIEYNSAVGGSATATLTGTGVQKNRAEVNCYGDTMQDAKNLRLAVVGALNGYVDVTTGITIQLIQPRNFFDHELLQYRAMVEFYVYYTL